MSFHKRVRTGTNPLLVTVSLAQREQLPFLAAAIAYYAFLSVVPLLIVSVAVASVLAGETVVTGILTATDEFLTPEAGELLSEALVAAPGRDGMTLVGSLVSLWGALRVFRGLDTAFSRIYGETAPKSLLDQLRDAIVVVSAVGLAVGVTVVVSAVPVVFGVSLVGVLGPVGLFVLLPLVFFPLYYVFPARDVTVREALPGTVLAAAGWALLGTLFGVYTAYAGGFQLYGVLGGVLLLLVWFYFGGLILLVGVAVNAVVAGRPGDRQLQQASSRRLNQRATMGEADGPTDDVSDPETDRHAGAETNGETDGADAEDGEPTSRAQTQRSVVTRDELRNLRRELERLESDVEDRTVHREELERDLKRYVRGRMRRGHATGWGPYLVLLYGTAMTLGAFYFLSGGWAILAMVVIWLSTLGLYVLMILFGVTVTAVGAPGRVLEKIRGLR